MDTTPKPSRTNHLTPSSAFPKGGSAAGRKSWPRARADQFFGSAFPVLCSPEVTVLRLLRPALLNSLRPAARTAGALNFWRLLGGVTAATSARPGGGRVPNPGAPRSVPAEAVVEATGPQCRSELPGVSYRPAINTRERAPKPQGRGRHREGGARTGNEIANPGDKLLGQRGVSGAVRHTALREGEISPPPLLPCYLAASRTASSRPRRRDAVSGLCAQSGLNTSSTSDR